MLPLAVNPSMINCRMRSAVFEDRPEDHSAGRSLLGFGPGLFLRAMPPLRDY
jgi:hypothetical protein